MEKSKKAARKAGVCRKRKKRRKKHLSVLLVLWDREKDTHCGECAGPLSQKRGYMVTGKGGDPEGRSVEEGRDFSRYSV